jgi:hypothetical protein
VSQNNPFVLELHAKQPAGKFFQYRAGYFDAVFFTHKPPQHWVERPGPEAPAVP